MNRRAIVALMLSLAVVPLCVAGTPTSDFTISMSGSYLAVSGGQLAFAGATHGAWYIMGTQIKSSVKDAGYLAYDLKGEDNAVVLKSSPGKDTEWSINVPGRGKRSEGEKAVIRAASGPKKGWYLTVSEGRLILAEDPPQKLQAERIWKH